MTKTLLTREDAAKKAAEKYQNYRPDHGLDGIEYTKVSKKFLNGYVNRLYQNILIHAALESGLYELNELEETLRSEMQTIQDATKKGL